MRILVQGCTTTVKEYAGHPNLGCLATPACRGRVAGFPWAADNGCFTGFDPKRFLRFLSWCARQESPPEWVAVPDVVSSHDLTAGHMFPVWASTIRKLGLKRAFVLQNGSEEYDLDAVPWGCIDALFIGGNDAFKMGPFIRRILPFARDGGYAVHVGRVNSLRRLQYFADLGVTSCDGTTYNRQPWKLGRHLSWLEQHTDQRRLWTIQPQTGPWRSPFDPWTSPH